MMTAARNEKHSRSIVLGKRNVLRFERQTDRVRERQTDRHIFESHKNTTVSAANVCPAVCISDVTNKAGACDKRIKYAARPPFSAFQW